MSGYRQPRIVLGIIAATLMAAACGGGASPESSRVAPYKIGYVLALSGTGSAFADPAQQGMELAVEDINGNNAAGRPITTVIADDGTDPRMAAEACNRLVTQDKVDAIIGYESTPARVACNQAAQRAGIPYIASSNSGGDICAANLFQVGTVPNQQIDGLVDYLLASGARRFYLIGSDYSSPKASFARARGYLVEKGATVAGESYEPLGTTEFSSDIARIAAAKPDVVLSSLVGADGVPFYRQFATDPRTASIKSATFELKAVTARAIGAQANGILLASDYFPNIEGARNAEFVAAMQKKFGDRAEPSESAVLPYDAAHLLAAAVKAAGSTDGHTVIEALKRASFDGPRGTIGFASGNQYATFDMFVASVTEQGKAFDIRQRIKAIAPVLTCGS